MPTMDQDTNAIAYAIKAAGGIGAAAKACERSSQALSKWRQIGALPRTDYTGETSYARKLAGAARKLGNDLDEDWLLAAGSRAKHGQRKKATQGPPSFPQ